MLLAMLSASSSAYGKVIQPGLKPESLFKQAYAGCLTQKDSKFPQTVRVNISISNANQDTTVSPDVSSRSLAPWDYRYDLCPYCLEIMGCPGQEHCWGYVHIFIFSASLLRDFWKYEGNCSPHNSLRKTTNTEWSTEQNKWSRPIYRRQSELFL